MWIHQHHSWPNFTWDKEGLADQLLGLHRRQAFLLGRLKGLGFEIRRKTSLATLISDVVKSSEIEGENLDPKEVQSSIAKRLGLDIAERVRAGRDVEGVVEMMLDATQQFSKPLTKERLFDWHSSLFSSEESRMSMNMVGGWRTDPVYVVSSLVGKEKVHLEAPAVNRVEKEMQEFLEWFAKDDGIDLVVKAGVAHFWFVTIHPFEDGNGRIGRAICDMALARADGTPDRFYSLSSQIMAERKDYYAQLGGQQRATTDITGWLHWFLGCLGRAIDSAESTIDIVQFKALLWSSINQKPVNERQRMIINRMLDDDFKGFMNRSKYAKMAKCPGHTAARDIQELKERGVFIQNPGGGRSTSYRLPKSEEEININ